MEEGGGVKYRHDRSLAGLGCLETMTSLLSWGDVSVSLFSG